MKIFFTILVSLLFFTNSFAQSTCANAPTISSGNCINNQTFPGSVNMSGLCVGGSNPALYIKFVAGACSQFTITPSGSFGSIGSQILTSACAGVSGSLQCHDNVVSGVPFMADCHDVNGNYLLTSGTTYILRLWGSVGTSSFNICYSANVLEESSNECSGALSLGNVLTQYFNGGDCSFTGSGVDATTSDPAPSGLCAGSLENTQWIKFMPQSGVSQFQILGTNINCSGGGCGFQFGIFSGSCSSLVSEGCYGNKVCSGGQSVSGPTNTSATDGFSIAWSNATTTGFTATITKTGGGSFNGTEVFYLVMDGNSDADCQYSLQGVNLQALPIELISFTAENSGQMNTIKWTCATEINNQYFVVERSLDAVNWFELSNVNGVGNSTTSTNYTYLDFSFQRNTTNYYRLKQVDFNGDFKYFSIIFVNNNQSIKNVKKVFSLIGVEVDKSTKGFLIYQYSDDTYKKVYIE